MIFNNCSFQEISQSEINCHTLKFALFKIDENLFSFVFCARENIRKIIFFIKLKFIISLSNIVVHTCWCICFDVMLACCSIMCWVSKVFKMRLVDRSLSITKFPVPPLNFLLEAS